MLVRRVAMVLLVLVLMTPAMAFAKAKDYQVTGVVLAVTDDMITIQKGDEKWEIDRTASTKVTGDLKVGAKVTVSYTMSADSVDVKKAK